MEGNAGMKEHAWETTNEFRMIITTVRLAEFLIFSRFDGEDSAIGLKTLPEGFGRLYDGHFTLFVHALGSERVKIPC